MQLGSTSSIMATDLQVEMHTASPNGHLTANANHQSKHGRHESITTIGGVQCMFERQLITIINIESQ